jgi:hypothetical protein
MNITISYQNTKKDYTFNQHDLFSSYYDFKHFISDHFGTSIDNLIILRDGIYITINTNKIYIVQDMKLKEGDNVLINSIVEKATPEDYLGNFVIYVSFKGKLSDILIPKALKICDLYKMIDKENVFCNNYALIFNGEYLSRLSYDMARDICIKNKSVIELKGRLIEDEIKLREDEKKAKYNDMK